MAKRIQPIKTDAPGVSDLDPYRQLVALQKQMIELSKQIDCARRECDELRARVAAEASARRGMRPHLHQKSIGPFKMQAGMIAAKSNLPSLIGRENLPC